MTLGVRSNPEYYGRRREVLSALRVALIEFGGAIGFVVAGVAWRPWMFFPAAGAAVLATIEAYLVWRWAQAGASRDIDELLVGRATRVGDSQASEYGVDAAVLPAGQGWVYIRRDFEQQLDDAIESALSASGSRLVMLSGETKAGKTRAAFQALHRVGLDNAWVVVPRAGASIELLLRPGTLPKRWSPLVIWLDDIEKYASVETTGFQAGVLRNLRCDRPVLLLATEGGRGRKRYSENSALVDPVEQLRNVAVCVEVPVSLTDGESARTRDAYGERFAAESERVGLGRLMVASEEIRRKLTTGQQDPSAPSCREGVAVMKAAVGWRRAGAESPLSVAQINEIYPHYLPDDLDPSGDLLASGIQWAREPLPNTHISLLRKTTDGTGRFDPFDLAVEIASTEWPRVDEQALERIIEVAEPADIFQIASVAYDIRDFDLALRLFTLAESSSDQALSSLSASNRGALLHKRGDLEQAEAAYRRADELGSAVGANNLGVWFREHGELEQAELAWRRADERGSPEAASNLAAMFQERGDLDQAVIAARRADKRGSADGAFGLGILLGQQGKTEDAIAAYRRADARGSAGGAYNLGHMLERRNDLEQAEAAWGRADERGSAEGALKIGALFHERGELEQAEAAWRRADERGSADGALNLGIILEARGDLEQAEAAYRRADERGDAEGACCLGTLLEELGELEQAEAAWRRADERGSAEGALNLGIILEARGELEQAEAAYRRADERGDAEGASNLAVRLHERGDLEQAESAVKRADERGSASGANNLGMLFHERGELERAEAAWRRADERGSAEGAYNLGVQLYERGDPERAEAAWHRADERGHGGAALNLAIQLRARGELEQAEAALRRADERGHPRGSYLLGVLLEEHGKPEQAEAAYRRARERGYTR